MTLYVTSIAEIVDRQNVVVGWAYRATSSSRSTTETSMVAGPNMTADERQALRFGLPAEALPLPDALPAGLRIQRCPDLRVRASR
jgi:hypothetical protein